MRGWIILAAILLALFLLSRVRLGVRGEYRAEALTLWLRLGPLRLRVFPGKKGKRPPKKPDRPKGERSPALEPEPLSRRAGDALAYGEALLPIALEAGNLFRRKLRVDRLEVELTVSGPDPARAALNYGRASAALGAAWGALLAAFDVKEGRGRVVPDLESGESRAYALVSLSLTLGQLLRLGIYFGIKALRALLAVRRARRGEKLHRKAA